MSREIKFRIWKKKSKEWVQNNMLFEFACETLKFNEIFVDQNKHYGEDFLTFQQFTGLTDVNNKEIYEGDILTFHPERKGKYYVVEFWPEFGTVAKHVESSGIHENGHEYVTSHFFSVFQWENYDGNYYEYKAVGNIYENPELLNPA